MHYGETGQSMPFLAQYTTRHILLVFNGLLANPYANIKTCVKQFQLYYYCCKEERVAFFASQTRHNKLSKLSDRQVSQSTGIIVTLLYPRDLGSTGVK